MKRLTSILALISLSAQAFVCGELPKHEVLETSEHGLLGEITTLDDFNTIQAKKTFAGMRSELFSDPMLDGFHGAVLDDYHNGIISYRGESDFYSVRDYIQSLSASETAKQGIFDGLVYGLRANSFTYQDNEWVLNGFVDFSNSLVRDRRFMPQTPEVFNFAIPGNICLSGKCTKATLADRCDPWTCR